MIVVVTPENEFRYRDELKQAWRLRHRLFVKQEGLEGIADASDLEIDEFDNKYAVHIIFIDQGRVLGYQRLLPTTRPHVLSDNMPELCEGDRPVGAHIWEASHQCIAPGHRFGRSSERNIARTLALALVEWGLECGVSRFVMEVEPSGLLPLVELHFRPLPLGLPAKIRGRLLIALIVAFNGETLARLRDTGGIVRKVLPPMAARPLFLHA